MESVRLLLEAGADPFEEPGAMVLTPCSQELEDMMLQALKLRLKKAMEKNNLHTLTHLVVNTGYVTTSFILLEEYKNSIAPYDKESQNQHDYHVWLNSQLFFYQAFYFIHNHAQSLRRVADLTIYYGHQSKARDLFKEHVIYSVSNLISVPLTDELVRALGLLLKVIQTGEIEKMPEQWLDQLDLETESQQTLINIVNSINQCLDELSKLEITEYQKQHVFMIVKEHLENILPVSEIYDSPVVSMS